ncbi:MAG: pyruvate kinase [Alphaproteobacteria bacterium]|nr:pyruvate kinase [Alphaproteobacteria bacterium]MBU0798228.1 pyruvate kinase [Alphaproteobacteria bacterium]MBU0888626.1 pyruvate kinase [Alphaproteobacteria bacterium]MBU1813640.1 pyruvate kinase [Alphaproteobacteria bacterium]
MRRQRSTKIVATLGPASATAEQIRALFAAGADVFRLNFSHGAHEDHAERVRTIRALEEETGRPIGIMMDLQGPKLRVGTFAAGRIELHAGRHFRLDLDKAPGDDNRVCLPHPEIFKAIAPGDALLLDDGKIQLKVLACDATSADTEVIAGGPLSDRKGVNVPNAVLDLSPLTDKDRRDLAFGLDLGVDWVALSFVQRPDDIAEARKLIAGRATIIAKLEKPSAIRYLNEIIEMTDAVMVARGDLGVEMAPEDVPSLQKQIVRACRIAGKPVIVATQMLESMIVAPAPTRAEASDVATAVYDGADAVMLSAESAAGKYPVESVGMMNRIITRVERDSLYRTIIDAVHGTPDATGQDAITAAARQVAETISAVAIVTYTTSGSTTLRASRERPTVPILCLTSKQETARRLSIAWGVHSMKTRDARNFADMVQTAQGIVLKEGFGQKDDKFVVTAGVPFGTPGATNVLRIARV